MQPIRIFGDPFRTYGAGGGVSGILYLLRDEFTTDAAAPLTSPRTAEPGPGTWTITDASNRISIASGKITVAAAAGATRLVSGSITRAEGLALKAEFNFSAGAELYPLVYGNNATTRDIRVSTGATFSVLDVGDTGANYIRLLESGMASSTSYQITFILRAVGAYVLLKGGAYADWTLLFVTLAGNSSYPMTIADRSASEGFTQDFARSWQLGAPFTTSNGFASVNVASPADGASQTATADAVHLLTLTAPGTITTEAGLRYRITDANNYWRAYFDTSGAFRIDSVAAGTPTNRVNVAGVIAAGATRTIQVRALGSLHNAYSLSGTAWTKRGTEVNVSHQNTSTPIAAEIGAGWTAANLISYPCTSSAYVALDA